MSRSVNETSARHFARGVLCFATHFSTNKSLDDCTAHTALQRATSIVVNL